MASFKNDYKYGIRCENEVFKLLKEKYTDLETTYKGCEYDFISNDNKIIFELKSRNVYKDQYHTTIIGKNKLDIANKKMKEGYKVYFLFKFNDGLYYTEYTDDMEYTIKPFCRNQRTDYNDIEKNYVFIPISILKLFS